LPTRGEAITITATPRDGAGAFLSPSQVSIWFVQLNNLTSAPAMSAATPVQTCSSPSMAAPCQFNTTPAPGTVAFAVGCQADAGGKQVWSGWKTTPIEAPDGSGAIPVIRTGPKGSRIDVVFIPDANSYEGYGDRNFQTAVLNVIMNGYYSEDVFLQHQNKFNFWISRTRGRASDADASGCVHSPPSDWDDHYAFAEVGVILHTWDVLAGAPFFRDCAPHAGSYVSGSGNDPRVVLHETGHTPFGLADEYPPDGGYWQPNPHPNIYADRNLRPTHLVKCSEDALTLGRPASACRRVVDDIPFFFWTSEPTSNDLMNDNGTAQAADIRRIKWMFRRCEAARC
jgi:hypothetical protein